MKKFIAGISILAVIAFGVWFAYFRVGDNRDFVSAFQSYNTAWKVYQNSAHIPGAEKNTMRQEVNDLLSQALDQNLSEKKRLLVASKALDPLASVRAEIDDMKAGREDLQKNVSFLAEKANEVRGIRMWRSSDTIARLAKKRMIEVKEVEDLSYKMNDTTKEIFQGIARDNGKLTDERIRALNEQVPAAEKDFDRLNELYRSLDDEEKTMSNLYASFLSLSS